MPGFPDCRRFPPDFQPVVVQYLRTTLGFKGLIVTDSLSAGAISALHLAEPAASVKALARAMTLFCSVRRPRSRRR